MTQKLVIEVTGSDEVCNKIRNLVQRNPRTMRILEDSMNFQKDDKIISGELEIDILKRQVRVGNKHIVFTSKEFDILFCLAVNPGKVFSHREIYEAVWKKEYFQDAANITAHIGHIRKKLRVNADKHDYIQTVHGRGYKFNCER